MKVFLDSNVLVYRVDYREPDKQAIASQLIDSVLAEGDAVISTQSLQEFYNATTRKLGLAPVDARRLAMSFSAAFVVQLTPQLIFAGMARHASGQFSFWDALIVEAALAGGAKVLYTEDMRDGTVVDGLRICNPFLGV